MKPGFSLRPSTRLGASVALNVLLGLALWLKQPGLAKREMASAVRVPVTEPEGQPAAPSAGDNPSTTSTWRQPFRWSQLESPDFHTYASNLRAIGCPESTVRDIVAGEIREIYAEKRSALARHDNPGGRILSGAARREWEASLERLRREEDLAVRDAIYSGPPQTSPVAQELAAREEAAAELATLHAQVRPPLVLHGDYQQSSGTSSAAAAPPNRPAPSGVAGVAAEVPEAHREAVQQIREKFVQDVSTTGLAADDPAYLEKWLKAQADADAQLQAKVGWQDFNRMQLDAARAEIEVSQKNVTK